MLPGQLLMKGIQHLNLSQTKLQSTQMIYQMTKTMKII